MEIIKKSDEKIVFLMKSNNCLANAIRRSVSSIPTMAIDEVEISRNDSPLYDETLAHRIGLVPLKFEKGWKEGDVLKMKLNVKKAHVVYSGDFKGDCEVVFDKIPLTILEENKEVKIKATTKMGRGKDHAKFSPGLLFFRNVCEITMDKEFEGEIKKIFSENEVKVQGNKIIVLDNKEKPIIDFCGGLAQRTKKKIEIKNKEELVFTLESFGQMKAEEIFKKAVDILKKEISTVSKKIK